MHRKKWIVLISSILMALLLASCGAGETGTPTPDAAAVYTAAAETASIRLTEMLAQTPSPIPQTATPTQDIALTAAVQTVAVQLTQTAAAGVTPTQPTTPTVTPPVASGALDRAAYVADVTIPDGTDFQPKQAFTKTWRIQNNGTTTWTTEYSLVFVQGDKMGGPDTQRLTVSVAPGTSADLSVNLVAPETTGRYTGWWKLLNASGQFFDEAFYVQIDVVTGAVTTPVATNTPGGPTATATATSSASNTITNLAMAVDNATVTGACPQTFNFTGTFNLSTNALVTYRLEAGSDTPGVTFNLPGAQTVQMNAGAQTLTFNLNFTDSMEGWVRLRITSPVDVTSNQADFTLTCSP